MDPFAAGIAESIALDGQLGPLFSCIVGTQMHNLKLGDRLFYTHTGARFTTRKYRTYRNRSCKRPGGA